jgi:hypothetical protein
MYTVRTSIVLVCNIFAVPEELPLIQPDEGWIITVVKVQMIDR